MARSITPQKPTRSQLAAAIAAYTDYDADTIRISRDGSITALLDPDKVPGCHHVRLRVAQASAFANGANPFVG